MKRKIKVLLFDIETAPIIGYVWGLWDQTVGLNQIKSDWHLLSWSAKWLDDPASKVMYMDQRNEKNIENDKNILKALWKLLDAADVVITQNGIRFDSKKVNARFILNGMKPPSSYKHIDTCKIASRVFGFTSNKLEYLTDKLNTKYKKLKHAKFSGFSLWKECLAGNIEAWNEMKKYNMYDVLSLEELYHRLQPWDNSINFDQYEDSIKNQCNCGSFKFKKNGYKYTKVGKYQRYQCTACGSETRGRTDLTSKNKKKTLKA